MHPKIFCHEGEAGEKTAILLTAAVGFFIFLEFFRCDLILEHDVFADVNKIESAEMLLQGVKL